MILHYFSGTSLSLFGIYLDFFQKLFFVYFKGGWGSEKGGQKERERKSLDPPFTASFSKCPEPAGAEARPKPAAQNSIQVSHRGGSDQPTTEPVPAAS